MIRISDMVAWVKRQWENKAFRILTAVMLAVTLLLGLEFTAFGYGALKIIRYYVIFWSLVMLAWNDCRSRRIPNEALLFLLAVRIAILVLECLVYHRYRMSILMSAGAGFLIGGGLFFVCYIFSRGGIGAGDVKLFAVLGGYMGGAIFTVIFLVVLVSACYSVVALLLKKVNIRQEIPFAPFVLAGTLIGMVLGV